LKAFSGSHFCGQGILLDCSRPVIANFGDSGYYRVQYEDAGLRALGASYKQLAPEDRVSLLADSWAMVQAGRADVRTYLDLTKHLTGETDLAVWTRVIDTLRQFDDLERGSPAAGRSALLHVTLWHCHTVGRRTREFYTSNIIKRRQLPRARRSSPPSERTAWALAHRSRCARSSASCHSSRSSEASLAACADASAARLRACLRRRYQVERLMPSASHGRSAGFLGFMPFRLL
jgi:ERAP1-like C-terminal domain